MNEVLHKLTLALLLSVALAPVQAQRTPPRTADYIAAIVNQELVTAVEVDQRIARIRAEAERSKQRIPAPEALRRYVLESLIDERVVITYARESGVRVDDGELDRAMASIASQNQISVQQLRERLAREGTDYTRFRADIRDQILIERVREREVQSRIRVSDEELDAWLAQQRGPAAAAAAEYDIAQILVTVPENAADTVVAERRSRAEAARARGRGGEPFEAVAREMSEDANREQGGSIGLRPADRLPDVFLEAVRNLKPGDVSPTLLKTGAGFHVLKLVERREGNAARVTQTRVRHILLRTAPPVTAEAAARRLADLKQQITTGGRRFEDLAREHSEDGTAPQGGDLGWANAGSLVPEFEQAMNQLPPGGISDPVASRFGVHLIQVLERRQVALDPKQLREQGRTALRERKFQQAFADWVRELRSRAYIEMREPPG
jgi:peptidyl-prolyl cis-trans isomerase SurA